MASAIPHDLDLTIDYVNTLDIEAGTDELATPSGLGAWLTRRGLLSRGAATPSAAELEAATRLRDALRAVMLEHNGGPHDEHAGRELDRVARSGQLEVRFAPDDTVVLRPAGDDFDAALAALLIPVAHAARDGSWRRAKACRADDCHWAFYDRSRNRSGTWCDMTVCGNRTKVRAYRRRAPQAR